MLTRLKRAGARAEAVLACWYILTLPGRLVKVRGRGRRGGVLADGQGEGESRGGTENAKVK